MCYLVIISYRAAFKNNVHLIIVVIIVSVIRDIVDNTDLHLVLYSFCIGFCFFYIKQCVDVSVIEN